MRRWAPMLWYGTIFATSCTVIHRDRFVATVGTALPTSARNGWATLWDESWWVFVKGWHATEFAILLVLTFRATRNLGSSLFLVSLAALLDEFHQTFVPGRGGLVSGRTDRHRWGDRGCRPFGGSFRLKARVDRSGGDVMNLAPPIPVMP